MSCAKKTNTTISSLVVKSICPKLGYEFDSLFPLLFPPLLSERPRKNETKKDKCKKKKESDKEMDP